MASAVGAAPLEGADAPIPGPQDLPDDILVTLMLAMDLPSRVALCSCSRRLADTGAQHPQLWAHPTVCVPDAGRLAEFAAWAAARRGALRSLALDCPAALTPATLASLLAALSGSGLTSLQLDLAGAEGVGSYPFDIALRGTQLQLPALERLRLDQPPRGPLCLPNHSYAGSPLRVTMQLGHLSRLTSLELGAHCWPDFAPGLDPPPALPVGLQHLLLADDEDSYTRPVALPPAVAAASSLRSLHICTSELGPSRGVTSGELRRLCCLTSLSLCDTNHYIFFLSSRIGGEPVLPIALQGLRELCLLSPIALPPAIARLTGLSRLELAGFPGKSLPPQLWRLPSLQVLSLLGATELQELGGDPQGLHVGELHIESKAAAALEKELVGVTTLRRLVLGSLQHAEAGERRQAAAGGSAAGLGESEAAGGGANEHQLSEPLLRLLRLLLELPTLQELALLSVLGAEEAHRRWPGWASLLARLRQARPELLQRWQLNCGWRVGGRYALRWCFDRP